MEGRGVLLESAWRHNDFAGNVAGESAYCRSVHGKRLLRKEVGEGGMDGEGVLHRFDNLVDRQ